MVSHELVQCLQLPTTLHPHPYQLGWVQQGGPRIQVSTQCAITFTIGPFHDVVTCDVAPLDCTDLLLGIPYQQDRHTVYHAKTHRYHLRHQGCTYMLTSSNHPSLQTSLSSLNQCVSLCPVRPIKPDNLTNLTLPEMAPLLKEFADVFTKPTGLPPSRSIEHFIELLPGASLLDASTYRLAPRESDEIESDRSTS